MEENKVTLKDINLKNINWKTIKGLYLNYKEVVNYLVFGGLTTIVNFVAYCIFAKLFGIDEVLSSGIAWVCGVIFAYVTNKIFVFDSKTETKKELLKECASFFLARVVSGITCDVGTFALMVKVFNINDIVSKIVTQVMVVIVNYLFSKFVVFRKNGKVEK